MSSGKSTASPRYRFPTLHISERSLESIEFHSASVISPSGVVSVTVGGRRTRFVSHAPCALDEIIKKQI
jgi:hypothetical protein